MFGRRTTRTTKGAGLLRPAVPLGVLLAATGAFAYFTATGSGAGSSTAGTTLPVSVAPATPTTQLYPGGASDVALTISNPNPAPVHIGALALDASQGTSGFVVDGPHSGCGIATLSFASQSNGGAGWLVPAKVGTTAGTLAVDLTGAVSMTTVAATSCQGASFTVYLKATP